jgi:hypothetical protein
VTDLTQPSLTDELEALLSALMAAAEPGELALRSDRLEQAVASEGELAVGVLAEIRSALELVRAGQPCAAVSSLLAARSGLTSSAR